MNRDRNVNGMILSGVGAIIEWGGPGIAALSVPERATITNMGTELGATTSIFPSDDVTRAFLAALDELTLADITLNGEALLLVTVLAAGGTRPSTVGAGGDDESKRGGNGGLHHFL